MKYPKYLLIPNLVVLGAWLLCAGDARADATPWPQVPSPPKSKVEWVAESMRVNGVPMRVMHFESSAGRTEIIEYYRSYWSGGYPVKPSVQAVGDATVVGQAHGPYFLTVKVKDAPKGASEGLITVSRILGSKIERSPGEVPLVPGAKVIQVVESNDPGRRSREVLISIGSAASSVVNYYQAALSEAGWRQVQFNDAPAEKRGPRGSFLVFARDRSEMQLSVRASPDGRGSMLAAVVVTKDTVPEAF